MGHDLHACSVRCRNQSIVFGLCHTISFRDELDVVRPVPDTVRYKPRSVGWLTDKLACLGKPQTRVCYSVTLRELQGYRDLLVQSDSVMYCSWALEHIPSP